MFKKKCPICGARNPKERMVCIECGAPLDLVQVKGQLAHVSTEGEIQTKREVEKAPKERTRDEYWGKEKVLYKTRGKLSLPNKAPEEVDCIVTEDHLIIESKEPMKIPMSHIQEFSTSFSIPPYPSTQPTDGFSGTVELRFLDHQNRKQKLSLGIPAGSLQDFRLAVDGQRVGKFSDIVEVPSRHMALVEFFLAVPELFRDMTRDSICHGLQRIGIDARMAPRGRPEEKICGRGSLGIIHIPEGPFRWINVRKETHSSGQSSYTVYYTEYGVPDPRLEPNVPKCRINTVRVKTFPVFGKVVDSRWKGWDSDLGIIGRLNGDDQLKLPIMESRDVTITAIGDYSCWIISTQTRDVPSGELWNCYQAIAHHLLTEWPPSSNFQQTDYSKT